MFVILAGLIEFSASMALCLGFLNRLTCLATCLYFLVAGTLGKHFSHGFIWASPGGGWEFVVLWSFIILVCSFNRSFGLSVDYWLQSRFKVPGWLSVFMARKIR
jgi:putative oxidoreductase